MKAEGVLLFVIISAFTGMLLWAMLAEATS